MLERATVTKAGDGYVDVAMVPSAGCAACGACAERDGMRHLSNVTDPIGAHVGDTVEVFTPEPARHRAQWLAYVAPVAAVFLGYMAGFLLSGLVHASPDTVGAIVGLCSGAVMLLALRVIDRNAAGSGRYESRVRAIISRGKNAEVQTQDRLS